MKKHGEIPAWGGNYTPFRLVARDTDNWSVTLDEVNAMSYDSTKLFRSSLNIDIGIAPFSLIVLFDGTLVLPRCLEIPKVRALMLFNQHLTDLLLSGLFSGEILPDDVTPGRINLWGYHRHECPSGRYSKLSQALRARKAHSDDAIALVDIQPLTVEKYKKHHQAGSKISQSLPENLASVFLPSCTAFCNEEWERALILGWSCAELLISQLWDQHVLAGASVDGIKKKRRKDFLSDTRTWTSSTRIELLWQKGLINDTIYAHLDRGRSARNAFIHSVSGCAPEDTRGVIEAVLLLIENIASSKDLPFNPSNVLSQLDSRTTVFRSPIADEQGRLLHEPRYWKYPDPAPGFDDWGDRPFEKIPEIQLMPLPPKKSNKTTLLTPDLPPVPAVSTATTSTPCSSLAPGQA